MSIPQTVVNAVLATGVPGELAYDGPHRAFPWQLQSTPEPNIVGATAYTVVSEGIAMAGGTGEFAGILINPKAYANFSANGGLAPTMTLPDNTIAELLIMGTIYATIGTAAAIGDLVEYNTTTGALQTVARGTTTPTTGFAFIPNCKVVVKTVTAAGLAIIELTD